jgi:SAM-dependent methyltransferase
VAEPKGIAFIRRTRVFELELALPFIPPHSRVLEIGAGSGWQARALADRGHQVEAVDVSDSTWLENRVHPVTLYDGVTLPFDDAEFDVVFSSNVLEHIPHIEEFQQEILRVLRPGGLAIHLMPTATWRIFTTLSFYPRSAQRVLARLLGRRRASPASPSAPATNGGAEAPQRPGLAARLRQVLLPPRHGERGNLLTEVFWFSRFRWLPLFRRAGWTVVRHFPTGLFYTGGVIHGSHFDLPARRRLSRVLGSACRVYVLAKPTAGA